MISVTGATPGSNIQAFYPSNVPASDPVCVTESDFLLRLWFPLQANKNSILVTQTGCSAGTSPPVPILKVTKDLLAPPQIAPVLPEATELSLSGLIPGARVYVSLNGILLPGGFDVYTATATIPILGGPPVNADQIAVTQALCEFTSRPGDITVATGTMALQVQPTSGQFDDPVNVTVTAIDASNGKSLAGLPVFVGPTQIGTTGTAFPAPSTPGPVTVTFTVTDVVNGVNVYNPATISFNVTKASLTVTPTPDYAGKLRELTGLPSHREPD
jgi:hypothetical protein